MEPVDLFKNLVVMAAADRSFTSEEIQYLTMRAHKIGLSDEEFRTAMDFAMSGEGSIDLPESESDRKELLTGLIKVMAADGDLAEVEKEMFAVAAANMDITAEDLNALIDSLVK